MEAQLKSICIVGYLAAGLLIFPLSRLFPKQFGPTKELMVGVVGLAFCSSWFLGTMLALTVWSLWPFAVIFAPFLPALALESTLESVGDRSDFDFGEEAVCITDLRLGGKIRLNGTIYNARSIKEFLPKGTRVRVLRKQGFNLVAEQVLDSESDRVS